MNHNHGVDVLDVTRNFTSDEWSRLHEAGMISYIRNQRNYTNSGGQRQVAAVDTLPPHHDPATLVPPAPTPVPAPSGRGNQNGGGFGHGRYNRS
jgi:hypothetical protein